MYSFCNQCWKGYVSDEELEELCDLAVRGLEELIDYQQYPIISAELIHKGT